MSDDSNSAAPDAGQPTGRGARGTKSAGGQRRAGPNYAARRMLVGTAAITVAFIAAVVGWRVIRDEPSGPERDTQSWEQIVFVNRLSGDTTWIDRGGDVVGESTGAGRTGSVYASDGVVALANSSTLTVLADPNGDVDNLVVALPAQATIVLQPIEGRTLFVAGSSNGGDVVVVDPVDLVVTDIGEVVSATLPSTPVMFVGTFRTNLDGSLYAVADATNFQTIAVRPNGDPPVFLPDQPIAVGDEIIATSQTVGLQADISLVTLERVTEADVPTEIPAGGEMDGDTLTVVSVGGGVFRVEPGDEEAQALGTLATPAGEPVRSVAPAAGGTRLVVSGTTFQGVVDLDGDAIYSTVLPQAVEFADPEPSWGCLPVGGTGHWATIVDLTTGDHLADLTGVEVLQIVDDGCTVLADRDGVTEVVSPDGVVTVGASQTFDQVLLAPDGQSVITVGDGTTQLITFDGFELGEPIDLTEVAGTNTLISFVPD